MEVKQAVENSEDADLIERSKVFTSIIMTHYYRKNGVDPKILDIAEYMNDALAEMEKASDGLMMFRNGQISEAARKSYIPKKVLKHALYLLESEVIPLYSELSSNV